MYLSPSVGHNIIGKAIFGGATAKHKCQYLFTPMRSQFISSF